jgi:membrane-bound serine protease (ClpP class)
MRTLSPRAALLLPALLAAFSPPVVPLGIGGWAPALLLLAGLLMVTVELFVLPGFGIAGAVGLLALVAGIALVVLGPVPGPADVVVAAAAIVSSVTLVGVAVWGVASRLREGHPLFGGKNFGGSLTRGEYRAVPPRPELEGVDGVAVTDLRPAGVAEIGGERLDVVAEAGWVAAGSPVRVVASEGWRLVVREVPLLPDGEAGEGAPRHPGGAGE